MCPPSVLLLKCPPSSKSHPWEVPTLVLPPAAFYQWPPHLGGFTTSPEKREGLFATGEAQPPRSTDGNTNKKLEINLYVFMKECTIVIDAWEVEVSNWRLLWPFGFLRETMFSLTPTFDAFKNWDKTKWQRKERMSSLLLFVDNSFSV